MFMFEKALVGGRRYWLWILFLFAVIAAGFFCYLRQLNYGLGITGLSRDVTWGLYIAQFTFLVGVAASAVMVVLPYYLHDCKAFGTHHHPGRVPGRGRRHDVHAVHLRGYGPAHARAQRVTLSDAALDDVLGHGLARRLPGAECSHRLHHPARRARGSGAARTGSSP